MSIWAHHYAFLMKVTAEREPESFSEAAHDHRWIEHMDEKMQALVDNVSWDLVAPLVNNLQYQAQCRWATTPLTDTKLGL